MRQVFEQAYRQNLWGDPESISGPGSSVVRTAAFRDEFFTLLKELKIATLLDAGCGDFNWLKEIPLPCEYVGIDVVDDLIVHDQQYATGNRLFLVGDITRDALPCVDMILCRDCLAHFSVDDVRAALHNFKKSGSRYLLTTTFIAHDENIDIVTGAWWPINLERSPFRLPRPEKMIDEKCLHTGGIYTDKRLALWHLSDVPVQ